MQYFLRTIYHVIIIARPHDLSTIPSGINSVHKPSAAEVLALTYKERLQNGKITMSIQKGMKQGRNVHGILSRDEA